MRRMLNLVRGGKSFSETEKKGLGFIFSVLLGLSRGESPGKIVVAAVFQWCRLETLPRPIQPSLDCMLLDSGDAPWCRTPVPRQQPCHPRKFNAGCLSDGPEAGEDTLLIETP